MIVCCGEALIDMLPRVIGQDVSSIDGKMQADEKLFYPIAGGAVFNTAIALGRLSAKVGFFSGISTDQFGEILIGSLEASHVDHQFCKRSDLPTTLAFVALKNGHAKYTFYDEGSAGRMVSEADLPDLSSDVKALHFGAISLIPEPCGSAYEALMQRETSNAIISFDPNIRANFIPDQESHRTRMARMSALSDIIKVSDEDIDWMHPGENRDDVIKGWLLQEASLVCLTKGAEGVTAYTQDHIVDMAVKPTTVADTVGAGDSFNAGILHALDQQELLTKSALRNISKEQITYALDIATQVASITVSRAGANPPWAHEMPA